MGWSRKMCTSMIKGFREAVLVEPAAAADLRVENVRHSTVFSMSKHRLGYAKMVC